LEANQAGEHNKEKITENSIGRLKNLWKHYKLSEEKPAYFSLKWKQKSLKAENSLRVLQPANTFLHLISYSIEKKAPWHRLTAHIYVFAVKLNLTWLWLDLCLVDCLGRSPSPKGSSGKGKKDGESAASPSATDKDKKVRHAFSLLSPF
jgi:hypothetical protein